MVTIGGILFDTTLLTSATVTRLQTAEGIVITLRHWRDRVSSPEMRERIDARLDEALAHLERCQSAAIVEERINRAKRRTEERLSDEMQAHLEATREQRRATS